MMVTRSNSHNLGSLPRISYSTVRVWPWVNTPVPMCSVCVFGSSWCFLQLLLLAIHWPWNCPYFCRSLLKASQPYLRMLECALLFQNFWKLELPISEMCVGALLHSLSLSEAMPVPPGASDSPGTHQAYQWAGERDTMEFGWTHWEWTHFIALLLVSRSLQRDPGSEEE